MVADTRASMRAGAAGEPGDFRRLGGSARSGGLGGLTLDARLLGACFYVAWIEVIYSSEAFVPSERFGADAAAAIFPLSTLGLVLGLVLAAFSSQMASAGRRVRTLLARRSTTLTAAAAGSLCTLFACVPGYLPFEWCFYAAALGTGACTSVIATRCAAAMVEMDSRTAIISLAAVQFIAILIFSFAMVTASYLGAPGTIAVLCLLLPLSALLLETGPDLEGAAGAGAAGDAFAGGALPAGYGRVVAVLAVLGFGTCTVRGFFPNFMSGDEFAGAMWATATLALVAMAGIAVWAARVGRSAPYGTICYRMLLGVTVLAAVPPALGMSSWVSGVVATVLFMVTLLITWAVLLRISFKTGTGIVAVFGFGFGAVSLGCDLGFICGHRMALAGLAIPGFDLPTMTGASVAAVLACVLVAVLLLRRFDVEKVMEPRASDDELFVVDTAVGSVTGGMVGDGMPDAPRVPTGLERPVTAAGAGGGGGRGGGIAILGARTPFRLRCDAIALEYGLSAREGDVLFLMAKGNDAKAIAEALFVSYNTARTHIRNIYAKMDVHSRHEFFDIVNDPGRRA